MLKTKFIIKDFKEFMNTYKSFNEKILDFNEMHISYEVIVKPYIGNRDFIIEIIIDKR